MENSRYRVVVDTNLWISYLIGSDFGNFLDIINLPEIECIVTERLINEVIEVTHRDKFRRYFDLSEAYVLINWLRTMTFCELDNIPTRCRDPKDDYLLELAVKSNAVYLVSGDKDLLTLREIKDCRIMTVQQFVEEVQNTLNPELSDSV